jgi:hypothetical protein
MKQNEVYEGPHGGGAPYAVNDGEIQCPNGGHDFELMPVPGGMGFVLGESRCRACGALAADEVMVDGGSNADRVFDGASWGRWRFNPSTNQLEFHELPGRVIYEIDLGKIRSRARCLDVIYQAAFKAWMTAQDRSDLLEAIRDLVRPGVPGSGELGILIGHSRRLGCGTRRRTSAGRTGQLRNP